ncbi:MAG TPA: hypothetical protein PK752_21700, partial [Accumulibacter sp.]|uniref:hypothetical protein n=1 Tax=Accumulibacter sp. TaxID=2053492 RepID=UPI002CC90F89
MVTWPLLVIRIAGLQQVRVRVKILLPSPLSGKASGSAACGPGRRAAEQPVESFLAKTPLPVAKNQQTLAG